MKNHDYEAALDYLNSASFYPYPTRNKTVAECFPDHVLLAIRHALKIAHKIMQEPSTRCYAVGHETLYETDECLPVFKAMRDQMLKEIKGEVL